MNIESSDLGFYSVFGITERNQEWLTNYFSKTVGIIPRVITYSNNRSLFYFTNYGDLAETGNTITIKLGFIRSAAGVPLSSQELLGQQLVKPDGIKVDQLTGNYLLAAFSRSEPRFSVYQSIMALPQLYYTSWEGGILCSTNTRVLVNLLQKVEFDDKIIPTLFFFRNVSGPLTFFKNVNRLYSGELLVWANNQSSIKLLTTLKFPENTQLIKQIDNTSISTLSDKLVSIMGAYLADIKSRGQKFANLLSGGVDSSAQQFFINQNLPKQEKPLSFSYVWNASSFGFEVEYARHASGLLNTQHTFYEIQTQEFADLLIKSVESLSQPNVFLVNSTKYILARYLDSKFPLIRYFCDGQCSDGLFGIGYFRSSTFRYRNFFHYMPGSYALLHLALPLIDLPHGKFRLGEILRVFVNRDTFSSLFIPRKYLTPVNRFGVEYIVDLHRRMFGDKALLDCLDYRYSLCSRYSPCSTLEETIQDIDLLTGGYESAVHNYALSLAQHKEIINFYLDQEVMRLARSFAPDIRYLDGTQTKPIIKKVLVNNSLGAIVNKKKGASGIGDLDFVNLIKTGALKDLVMAIDRPGFLNKRDFNSLMNNIDVNNSGFIWDLLVYDIFQKQFKNRNVGP